MRFVALVSIVALSAFACGYDSAAAPPPPAPLSVSGTWTGAGSDIQGAATFTLKLIQVNGSISGTVSTLGPGDGSCASCHKSTRGVVSGTLTGTTLALSMFFASGNDGVPTPMCSVQMNVSAANVTAGAISATYTGDDSCEGPITGGAVALTNSAATASRRSP